MVGVVCYSHLPAQKFGFECVSETEYINLLFDRTDGYKLNDSMSRTAK